VRTLELPDGLFVVQHRLLELLVLLLNKLVDLQGSGAAAAMNDA